MLWGTGDSSRLNDDEKQTLSHLRRMVETGHIVELNQDKSALLLRALDYYAGWEGTIRTMKHVRNVTGLFAFFFVSWWATGGEPIKAILELIK